MKRESFRITKRRVEAQLELEGKHEMLGAFVCSPTSSRHAGPEQVIDLLNDESRFVPFFPSGAEEPILVNKARIRVVTLSADETFEDPESVREYGEPRALSLILGGSREIAGEAWVSAPVGHTRTLDFLNEAGWFIQIRAANQHLIVNLDAVIVAADSPEP